MSRKTVAAAAAPAKEEIPVAQSWNALTQLILAHNDNEDMLRKMLLEEQNTMKRPLFAQKIYGRFHVLRKERERMELATGTWKG